MEKAYGYLKYYKKQMILGPIFKMFEVVFELIMPFLMSFIIDTGINEAVATGHYEKIYIPGLIIIGLILVSFCSTIVCQYYASVASQGFGTKLRNALYEKIVGLSLKDIDMVGKGNLTTIITNDVNRLQVSVAMLVRLVIRAPSLIIGSLICAFIINYKIAFIFVDVIVFVSLILFFVIKFSSKQILRVQKETDNIVTSTNDSLNGIRVVKAFNNENVEINKFKNSSTKYFNEMKKINLLNALTSPLTYLVINVAIVLVIYFSSDSIINGTGLTKGELTSLVQYLNQILLALIVVSNLVVIFTKAFASKVRVESILNIKIEIINDPKVEPHKINNGEDLIKFKNVSFKYDESDNDVIKNINFDIKKGQTIGIIGGTGSGKTTLVKLLLRFFDRTGGDILYKGTDIKDYDIDALRNEISLVNQKATIFKGTIRSNMLIGKSDATDLEIEEALKKACAYEFISKYDDYLKHPLEEGGKNLSGGQRQRLSIARSILKNGEILILDDSTSALDYLTEKNLKHNIKEIENLTTIIIAQRVTSLMNADQIIVMYHGEVESVGTHDELMKNSKVYKEIYDSQFRK